MFSVQVLHARTWRNPRFDRPVPSSRPPTAVSNILGRIIGPSVSIQGCRSSPPVPIDVPSANASSFLHPLEESAIWSSFPYPLFDIDVSPRRGPSSALLGGFRPIQLPSDIFRTSASRALRGGTVSKSTLSDILR